jgi:type III restriction enzyme
VKNDHLFFELPYRFDGRTLRYVPDFIVRLRGGAVLIVEGKGRATTRDASKESAARRWVAAVNADGRWGQWSYHVAYSRADVSAAIASR